MSAALAELCKGRWPDILRSLGLLSSAALAGRDQPCPTCGGHDRFRFTDKGYGRWFCRGCGMGGDGLRLVQAIKRVDFQTAASLVETVVGKVAESGADRKTDKAKPSDPMKPWREAGPFLADSPVDRYFRFRALIITEIEAQSLRYAASLFHWPSNRDGRPSVAQITLADGTPLGSHMTFVRYDGAGKAPVDRPRLFSGGTTPCGGGVWFGKADAHSEFVVAEGVESTLQRHAPVSRRSRLSRPYRELGIRRLVLPERGPSGAHLRRPRRGWAGA